MTQRNNSAGKRIHSTKAIALLLLSIGSATAEASIQMPTSEIARTECIGYYTLQLPGDIEYALYARLQYAGGLTKQAFFRNGPAAWNTKYEVDSGGVIDRNDDIQITGEMTQADLDSVSRETNEQRQRGANDLIRRAKLFDDSPDLQRKFYADAANIKSLVPFNNNQVYAVFGDKGLGLWALINNRIVGAGRKLVGTPQQTIDTFLHNYQPREPFDVPTQPGVCLPYAFMSGEIEPAKVGASLRFKDRPDIVINLQDMPVNKTDDPDTDMKKFMSLALRRSINFYGAVADAQPLDGSFKPFRKIIIDNREGLGAFVTVTRDHTQPPNSAVNNTANHDKDWGYVAYVPGDPNAPKGMSSNLTFRVERYGRFATQPMTEKEFRELVKTIAASIRRRPGAWRQQDR